MLLNGEIIKNSMLKGVAAAILLLSLYFTVITLVSGWDFARDQFSKFWYFVVTLAVGFGTQIGLYSYLKTSISQTNSGRILAISGTTSTAVMISCCSHYLANILPVLGAAGIVTFVSLYQIELFWVGIVFNLMGIIYMLRKISKVTV